MNVNLTVGLKHTAGDANTCSGFYLLMQYFILWGLFIDRFNQGLLYHSRQLLIRRDVSIGADIICIIWPPSETSDSERLSKSLCVGFIIIQVSLCRQVKYVNMLVSAVCQHEQHELKCLKWRLQTGTNNWFNVNNTCVEVCGSYLFLNIFCYLFSWFTVS